MSVDLVVTDKQRQAEGVVTLTLAHPEGHRLPDWTPGAHIDLVLPNGLTRQYSLCGDRWNAHHYRIAVRREGNASAYLHDRLRPGDRLGVGGPRNNFPMVPADRYRFIAGGIGITPLLPMIHQAELLNTDWSLLYIGHTQKSMTFLDELRKDRVRIVSTEEEGRPDLAAELAETVAGTRIYCCGPAEMLAAAEAAQLPPYSLHLERFTATEQAPIRADPFEVRLHKSGITVTVTPQISVLDAIRQAGVDLLSSCQQGLCGTCETAVLAGRPDHRDAILTDHERAAGDRMFPCVSRSGGDHLVLDL